MTSDQVVIAAPLSFAGSAERIWHLSDNIWVEILVLLPLIMFAWSFVAFWYFIFGWLVVPYRLIRRSSRKQKRDKLRHSELLTAMEKRA